MATFDDEDVFGSDIAMDVKDMWEEFLADGHSPAEAEAMIRVQFRPALADPDDGPLIVAALAALRPAP